MIPIPSILSFPIHLLRVWNNAVKETGIIFLLRIIRVRNIRVVPILKDHPFGITYQLILIIESLTISEFKSKKYLEFSRHSVIC